MPLLVNLRHLATHSLSLRGSLEPADLDWADLDPMVQVADPLEYEAVVQRVSGALLVQGRLATRLACQCVRCLKPFTRELTVPDWVCHVPLEGEDRAAVVQDQVDLTAYLREDILLALPQHPLCDPGCRGLPPVPPGRTSKCSGDHQTEVESSAWSELDKLKF
ncbi:MAG: DUF177 domain-containing protein [Verrucomicrobia bacterium]|nr:DUF177 domain-containing protein [Verrucomicrobiota bacterium]